MEQLAETVYFIAEHFKLSDVTCLGVGLGANVLARFAVNYLIHHFFYLLTHFDTLLKLNHPDKCNGIVLINCVSTKCGWIEWGYQKWNNWYLGSGQFTQFTQNYLLWHHFGYVRIHF